MKILIINYEYPPLGGGGGVATKQLAEKLSRLRQGSGEAKHEVHVLTTHHGKLVKDEQVGGVHLHRVKVWGRRELPTATILSMLTFVPMAFWHGWQICRRKQFDVINAQFVVPSGLPAVALARLYHVPFVLSFIGGDLYDPTKGVSPHRHPLLRALVRWLARQAVQRTAISEDTRQRAEQLHGVKQPIHVIHLGLIPWTGVKRSRRELGVPEGASVWVSIGRLIPRKRYEVLLEAWRLVPNAHLIILGSGHLEAELRKLSVEYGIADRVQLAGFVSEEKKMQLLHVADGYVSATEHEGFGIVFLEAMEAGLPIVAPDNGGQRDFLQDGQNALLVPTRDAGHLAAAVQTLLGDSALRQRLGENNRVKVKEFYLEKTAARFEEVLMQAARGVQR